MSLKCLPRKAHIAYYYITSCVFSAVLFCTAVVELIDLILEKEPLDKKNVTDLVDDTVSVL